MRLTTLPLPLPRMEPIEPCGGDLAAGKTVVLELNPNQIGRGIVRLNPDVFAPAVNDSAELADEFVILAIEERDDGSCRRTDKYDAGSVFDFLSGHALSVAFVKWQGQ